MNTKQEIIDAMNRENEGSAPPALFSQTGTKSMMEACGAFWPEANYQIEPLIKLALQPSERLGFATVRIPYDLTAEAERLGCELSEGSAGRQPMVVGSPWRSEEIQMPPELMPLEDFTKEGRVRTYLDAAERISKEHPDLFLTSSILGPLEMACHVLGMENFLMGTFMNPDATMKWVEVLAPYQCRYAEEMSSRCDNIFVITEAAEDVLPPDQFGIFAPIESQVYRSIKDCFSVAHVCGTTSTILEQLADMGATAVSVESFGDPQGIMDRIGGKTIVVGGVDPVNVLMQGTPEDVTAAAKKADAAGYDIIIPECGVPPITTDENLLALSKYREL